MEFDGTPPFPVDDVVLEQFGYNLSATRHSKIRVCNIKLFERSLFYLLRSIDCQKPEETIIDYCENDLGSALPLPTASAFLSFRPSL
jgi:hypothetical protein